ncbi:hypothetical protein FRC17_007466 [Serendipita sp. 399]|nr:hypothetical protein FRC17_007466 [Serendipita sp. 399]
MPFAYSAIATEIWEEIFEWLCINRQLPSRSLALVCRRWKEILLSDPNIWRAVKIESPFQWTLESQYDRLERRLKLAKGVTVDVTLNYTTSSSQLIWELLRTLARLAPVERWRSLWIINPHSVILKRTPFESGVFKGTFASLSVISITGNVYPYSQSPHVHTELFQLLNQSVTSLEYLYSTNLRILENIQSPKHTLPRTLTAIGFPAGISLAEGTLSLPSLREVTIEGFADVAASPNIPMADSLILRNCTRKLFSSLDMRKVVTLNVRFDYYDEFDTPVDLPALRVLCVHPGEPHCLQRFRAPNLEKLKLSGKRNDGVTIGRGEFHWGIKDPAISLFRKNQDEVMIFPVSLTVDSTAITDGMLTAMLEVWPQLKHLSLIVDSDFNPFTKFANRLVDGQSPICPALETIYLETRWRTNGRGWVRWRGIARDLMLLRKEGPLESITWRNDWFGVESVTRNERVESSG